MATIKRTVTNIEEVEREEVLKHREIEEVEEEIEVPVCDFCDQEFPEEDADSYLTSVVLNPQIQKRESTSETVQIPMARGFDKYKEIYRAVAESRLIDFQRKRVMEGEPIEFGDVNTVPTADGMMEMSDDLIAYEFIFRVPEPKIRDEGSIEVCEFCKSEFQ